MFQVGSGDARRARRFLAKNGDELAFDLVEHKEADFRGKRRADEPPVEELDKLDRFRQMLEQELTSPHRLADLAVNGSDLIELGFSPGPELGHVLHSLLHDVVEDPSLNTRDTLLQRAARHLRGSLRE
jgi:hypothetical protein